MKTLQLDAGNTRLKWRILNGSEETIGAGFLNYSHDFQACMIELIETSQPLDVICFASVNSLMIEQKLKESIGKVNVHVDFYQAIVLPKCANVVVSYPELGVDRWLSLLAAHAFYSSKKNKLIINCGTAMTVDFLSTSGVHQGGYIVPGIITMQKSLSNHTAHLPNLTTIGATVNFGVDTQACIKNGVLLMLVSLIRHLINQYKDNEIIITGGDSQYVLPFLEKQLEGASLNRAPSLVLDGLTIAYNQHQ